MLLQHIKPKTLGALKSMRISSTQIHDVNTTTCLFIFPSVPESQVLLLCICLICSFLLFHCCSFHHKFFLSLPSTCKTEPKSLLQSPPIKTRASAPAMTPGQRSKHPLPKLGDALGVFSQGLSSGGLGAPQTHLTPHQSSSSTGGCSAGWRHPLLTGHGEEQG